ncbi:LysR family transcriptional regulator [Salmonella enterica subsp. enterica serovar Bovismorbificans]|nr:LysR family transcriptional regulator [Salmonella enterica subsp. enterica serovar Bovismorbificans]
MDLRQLRYFVKVVELGNVTRASEALHIAQPAVSQQIRNLEDEMGMQLLERSSHGVAATAAGKTLHRHAKALLREADRTRELLRLDAEMPQGKVSVGLPSSSSRMFALPLARKVIEHYPGILLELIEVPTAEMPRMIENGQIDLAVAADVMEIPEISKIPLLSEDLCLIMWSEFEWPHDTISIAELAQLPIILPGFPNSIRMRVEAVFREQKLSCKVLFEASSIALLFAAVQEKLGVTILPWSAAYSELDKRKLKFACIEHPYFRRDISLCWRANTLLSNAAVKVKESILELNVTLREKFML